MSTNVCRNFFAVCVVAWWLAFPLGHPVSASQEAVSSTAGSGLESDRQNPHLFLFFEPSCKSCLPEMTVFLSGMCSRSFPAVRIEYFDITDINSFAFYLSLEEGRKAIGNGFPRLVIGGCILQGKDTIFRDAAHIIQAEYYQPKERPPAAGISAPQREALIGRGKQRMVDQFASLSVLTIVGAGFVDGINPCAFTTIVFFFSFLTLTGYDRRSMVACGIAFCTAVFITYILIGIGCFKFLQMLSAYRAASVTLYVALIVATLVLGLLSMYDYIIFEKTHDAERIVLQLPKTVKHAIKKLLTVTFRPADKSRSLAMIALLAFTAGFAVSLLETGCTGQMYLPTILFISTIRSLRLHAVAYLALYNIMFIVPLLAVCALGVAGISALKLESFGRAYAGKAKLIAAWYFFAFSVLLVVFGSWK